MPRILQKGLSLVYDSMNASSYEWLIQQIYFPVTIVAGLSWAPARICLRMKDGFVV